MTKRTLYTLLAAAMLVAVIPTQAAQANDCRQACVFQRLETIGAAIWAVMVARIDAKSTPSATNPKPKSVSAIQPIGPTVDPTGSAVPDEPTPPTTDNGDQGPVER